MVGSGDSDGFATPVPTAIDTRRSLNFSDAPEAPLGSTPLRSVENSEGAVSPAVALRDSARYLIRKAVDRNALLDNVRDLVRPDQVKAADYFFNYDKIKQQIDREVGRCSVLRQPPFDLATCERLIRKANRDFMTSSSDTAFLFLIPHSHLRPLAAVLAHCEILHVHPTGSEGIFSYRREHTYAGRPLQPAGSEGGGDRVFIAGTPFPIAIIYRDHHSAMRFTPERWLHAACAHAHGRRLAVVVDLGLDLGRPISRAPLLAHGALVPVLRHVPPVLA
ncbi:hypothetical protein CYMTET_42150 [Cymbomonas tetramitiformis]|uniref:Uncharacterized protein n=1 Tax=Cymbomonas tetramitiformis TaxID=36881 RepID=A0AAE0C613_9CHLO|nr:hypothetical protein CYMTET_42150 [Cymbomonas tetramitiformis]